MNEVLAALDNSLAATPVLTAAQSLAELLESQVVPVHVAVDSGRVARGAAAAAGLSLEVLAGPVVEQLLERANSPRVRAVVLGARGLPDDARTLGSTAVALTAELRKPVVLVPPDARPATQLRRVLVPIESGLSTSLAPRAVFEVARGTELEAVALHVYELSSLPAFTDQPQHEQATWTREFLRRYCPSGIDDIRLEVRVGRLAETVPLVADELVVDLVALGWARELTATRAPTVDAVLRRAKVPVMLVPVAPTTTASADHELASAT